MAVDIHEIRGPAAGKAPLKLPHGELRWVVGVAAAVVLVAVGFGVG